MQRVAPGLTYRHSGLSIASSIELPEWADFAVPAVSAPDVCISFVSALPASRDGEDVALTVEGIGEWLVRGGREILLRPEAGADAAQLRLFTLGSAWGALGYQRGFAMWHGSAAARGGRAVLVCGESGAGKSTLAAALVRRGAILVADDLSRIDPGGQGAAIHPASARLKLWGEVVDRFGWRERVLHPDWLRADKFHCAVPDHAPAAPALPLMAVVVLADGGPSATLTRLRGSEALEAVMAATLYRPHMLDTLGLWPQQGALAARILAATRVYQLDRPRSLDRLDESAALVESLWEP